MKETSTFEKLCKELGYAVRSNSEYLIYQCFGAVRMAYSLGAITKEEFRRLEDAIIPGWINNVAHREELQHTFDEREI